MQRPAFIFSIFAPALPRNRPKLLTTLLLTLFLVATAPAFSQPVNSAPAFSQPINSGPAREGAHPHENGTIPVAPPHAKACILKVCPDLDPGDGGNAGDTRIVVDKRNHVVRIFAGGKQVVTIDVAGLHVKGDLDHTGTDSDLGEDEHAK